jgi:hypothetical protein
VSGGGDFPASRERIAAQKGKDDQGGQAKRRVHGWIPLGAGGRPHVTWNLSRKAGDVFNRETKYVPRSRLGDNQSSLQICNVGKIPHIGRLSKLFFRGKDFFSGFGGECTWRPASACLVLTQQGICPRARPDDGLSAATCERRLREGELSLRTYATGKLSMLRHVVSPTS